MKKTLNPSKIRLESAQFVLSEEARALKVMAHALEENKDFGKAFVKTLHLIEKVQKTGKLIVSGMGKCAHVGRKIAATFASMGTPAFFVHPGEASHGDMGMITKSDLVITISNSGDTREIFDIYDYCDRFKIPYVGMTRNPKGVMAKRSNVVLMIPNVPEVCPIGKAPTTSTTMMMALGDALAVVVAQRLGLAVENYKHWHPGGKLGGSMTDLKSFLKLKNAYHTIKIGDSLEKVRKAYAKKVAPILVLKENKCIGFLTPDKLIQEGKVTDKMVTHKEMTIEQSKPVFELSPIFSSQKVDFVAIVDSKEKVKGIVYAHDLLKQ